MSWKTLIIIALNCSELQAPQTKVLIPPLMNMMNMAYAISLESPAGMGLSYSNTKSYYNPNADKSTAQDSYTFPISWLERLPQYKTRYEAMPVTMCHSLHIPFFSIIPISTSN